jgi:hypothetical protein
MLLYISYPPKKKKHKQVPLQTTILFHSKFLSDKQE